MSAVKPLLVDANSLIVRGIMASALHDLQADGTWTGGTYATLNTLRAFLELPEGHFLGPVVAFFDDGVPKARLSLLPGYKQERKQKKKLLTAEEKERAFEQLGDSRRMLQYLGVLCLSYKDREADDGVAAAAQIYAAAGAVPVVMTGDKDLWQTVSLGAAVWDLNGKRWLDTDTFLEATGLEPSVYLLYKALLGDPSDSILGSPGCGPKRARGLLLEMTEAASGFELAPPLTQLDMLRMFVTNRKKKRKFEVSLLESYDHLQRVLKAIDLSKSFGSTTGLAKRLKNFEPQVNKLGFLRFCKRLKFRSVLGDPERFVRPFRAAATRAR